MNNFWDTLIKPVLDAIDARTVVEIGALGGANTNKLVAYSEGKENFKLHVIDPAPQFHSSIYKDKIIFHQDISLNVIPTLPKFDVALIDGDHNWHTVYNELKQIEELHKEQINDFPVILLHDIDWPYGRRDLYYASSTIPDEFRQPAAYGGIQWGQSELSLDGGLNIQLYNAEHEGGPRNGVLTAVEDFINESQIEFELITIPAYFGVGILFAKQRRQSDTELDRVLSDITGPEGLLSIMRTLESIRARAMIKLQEQQREYLALKEKFSILNSATADATASESNLGAPTLSIIVIIYNMQREAKRTLHSLSHQYQQGIANLNYEVIIVDNGSSERLDDDFIKQFGNNFTYYYLEDAPSSPAYALNFGAGKAQGEILSFMIDGAHMLTPGVIKNAMNAFRLYENPVVATRYWFLGPGQQGDTIQQGYNKQEEDRLLESINWPGNGYRLFEIGVFILAEQTNWLLKPFESNCLFMKRETFNRIDGVDEKFDMPGGGFVNLDLYKRAVESDGATLVSILGEASFHQLHGGTTTNIVPEERVKLVDTYREQYRNLRGYDYSIPEKMMHFVGHIRPPAMKK